MEGARDAENQQRVIKWFEEGQSLIAQLRGALEETEHLRARVKAIEQECERLRQENVALEKEREEIIGTFGRLMAETLRPMNEIMEKIRGAQRKSPFERELSAMPANQPARSAPPGSAKP